MLASICQRVSMNLDSVGGRLIATSFLFNFTQMISSDISYLSTNGYNPRVVAELCNYSAMALPALYVFYLFPSVIEKYQLAISYEGCARKSGPWRRCSQSRQGGMATIKSMVIIDRLAVALAALIVRYAMQ
jgi:hypothetical protein